MKCAKKMPPSWTVKNNLSQTLKCGMTLSLNEICTNTEGENEEFDVLLPIFSLNYYLLKCNPWHRLVKNKASERTAS